MTESCFVFCPIKPVASLRRAPLRCSALAALCAAAAPAAAQTYVGNDFGLGSSLLDLLEAEGNSDKYSPFVILQEYSPSGPTTSGAIFGSAGTVNEVSFYGGGDYNFTVYALAPVGANAAQKELSFKVVGDETFSGDATTKGVQNLAANFSVGSGDYLAFAGLGPYYPQVANNAVGSDATYESSSEPQTYPYSFTAISPTAGQTFIVGAHGDTNATYEIVPNPFMNQGRSYAIGVEYTPSATPTAYYLKSGSLRHTNLSWSNAGGQSNWVDQNGATASQPEPGKDVYITNRTGTNASGPTIVNFDAATDPQPKTLTIDSNAGGQLVELSQSANTMTSGAETIGTTGAAEHLQTGGINNVTGTLTVNGFGTYDLQGGTLTAGTITANSGGYFFFNGGAANYTTFNLNSGGTVASGTAASLATVSAMQNINYDTGTGSEVVSAAGAVSSGFPSPMMTGGVTFNQSGGANFAGALTLGAAASQAGEYNLSGGSLYASSETIGAGGAGLFNQNGRSLVDIENIVSGAVTVGGGSFYEMGQGQLVANSLQINSGGEFDQTNSLVETTGLSVASGATYTLSGSGVSVNGTPIIGDLSLSDGTVAGSFTQSGESGFSNVSGVVQNSTLTIENGGVYDLQGGYLDVNTTIASGGQLIFDGGSTGPDPILHSPSLNTQQTYNTQITLKNGGKVTSGGSEVIDNQTTFTQFDGTNTTNKLTIVSPTSTNPVGLYDLQGGTLTAGTITANSGGYFFFNGGAANQFTTFNLNSGGTVASGTAASLATVSAMQNINYDTGTGSEVVSAAGAVSSGFPSPMMTGGVTFNQSGGDQFCGGADAFGAAASQAGGVQSVGRVPVRVERDDWRWGERVFSIKMAAVWWISKTLSQAR